VGGIVSTYSEEDDMLTLSYEDPGESTVVLPGKALHVAFSKTGEGFRLSLSTLKGEAKLKTLVIKNVGPAALHFTNDLEGSIEYFGLSWDGRDLKIGGLRIREKPLELNFITVRIDVKNL
jgi:hypothetical protein